MKKNIYSVPTLWRYFLKQYGQVLLLTLFGILVLLLSTRLEDFAKFISHGASLSLALLFITLQIPYVMQIALPLASLIASFYLFQKMSVNQSLTSLRAAGVSLLELMAPILFASFLLALFTFTAMLDLGAYCHRTTKNLERSMKTMNPLMLFHNKKLMRQQGLSIDMKGSLQNEGVSKDCIIARINESEGKQGLCIAKELISEGRTVKGKQLSIITALPSKEPNFYDHLVIENSEDSHIEFTEMLDEMSRKEHSEGLDEYNFSYLLAKKNFFKAEWQKNHAQHLENLYAAAVSEIARRLSLSFAIFTFTLLGLSAGITFHKSLHKERIIVLASFAALYIVSFLAAKSLDRRLAFSLVLYSFPHILMILYSVRRLFAIQRGITV